MIAEQVIMVIEEIAKQFGVALDKVYPMLTAQATVFCSTYHVTLWAVGISCALLIVGIIGLIISMNWYSTASDTLTVVSSACIVVFGVAFLVSGSIALCNLTQYYTALHNPDWWAVEYVLKLIK
jgi:uncharacterized membrane protein YobD (UPF0266 family)